MTGMSVLSLTTGEVLCSHSNRVKLVCRSEGKWDTNAMSRDAVKCWAPCEGFKQTHMGSLVWGIGLPLRAAGMDIEQSELRMSREDRGWARLCSVWVVLREGETLPCRLLLERSAGCFPLGLQHAWISVCVCSFCFCENWGSGCVCACVNVRFCDVLMQHYIGMSVNMKASLSTAYRLGEWLF